MKRIAKRMVKTVAKPIATVGVMSGWTIVILALYVQVVRQSMSNEEYLD
jgi:hypothetical protein